MTHDQATAPDLAAARTLAAATDIPWHQRFALAPGVYTPGDNDVERLFRIARIPDDLSGLSVLDIGASNGGACVEASRRGAARVVGVDICPVDYCAFDRVSALCAPSAEFVRSTIYELPGVLAGERFDLVLCFGVLYHLRHPLLALDAVRDVTAGSALVETAICDGELGPRSRRRSFVRFYRAAELEGDESNWFAPTSRALVEWCTSSGFDVTLCATWPPPRWRVRATAAAARARAAARRQPYVPVWRAARPGSRSAVRAMVGLTPTAAEPAYRRLSWAEGPFEVRRTR